MRRFITLSILLSPIHVIAETPSPGLAPAEEPPQLPMPVQSGETLEPDITIIRRGKKTIQEYRVNGELYMIKIVPDIGPAYYMMDTNGDGSLDLRQSDLERNIRINQWKIFSWK